jgi:hypothetical protein
MKRIIKLKERPAASKKGLTQKRRFLKGIRKHKKKYTQINAPHNTSQYLIENNSSPFYEDDDDTNVDYIPSSLIILDDSDDFMFEDSINQKKLSSASTLGESVNVDSLISSKQTSIFSLN